MSTAARRELPEGLQVTQRGSLVVVASTPAAEPSDAGEAWLVDAVANLVVAVREQTLEAPTPPSRLALVLHAPRGRDAQERAVAAGLAGAVRGIAQSLALELAPATCVNAVLCDALEDAEPTLALLADADGGFATGAAIDLRTVA
ncbi:MAG TPA: hypothetical protein VF250_13535 [Conexibacter sp.]